MAEKVEVLITGKDELSGVLGGIRGALGGLGTVALGLAAGGLAVLSAGVVGLGKVLSDSVGEAMEAQNVLAQLNQVIESTGGAAGVSAEEVQKMASELQKVTRFSDEAIIGGQNLLLTFTNIGEDIFPQATQTILDMSTALGQDLKSSAIQLGKALQDPIMGVTALRRVGVNFTEEQQEMIKSLVESGNLMEAQQLILKELAVEFGGSAEAAGKTFAGQLDILKNRFSEIKEELGLKVIPILQRLMDKVVIPLIPFIEKAADAFGNLLMKLTESKDFQVFINSVADGLQNLVGFMTDLAGGKFEMPKLGFEVLGDFVPPEIKEIAESAPVMGFLDRLAAWWEEHGPAIKKAASTLWEGLLDMIGRLTEKIQPFVEKVLNKFSDWMDENGPLIEKFVKTVSEWFRDEFVPALVDAWNIIEPLLLGLMDVILGLATLVMQVITGDWTGAWETAKQIVYDATLAILESLGEIGEWIAVHLFDDKEFEGAVDRFMSIYPEKFSVMEEDFKMMGHRLVAIMQDRAFEARNALVDNVVSGIQQVEQAFLQLVATLSNLILPSWLTGGTSFGVPGALLPSFGQTSPGLAPAFATSPGGGQVGGAGGGGVNIQLNYAPVMGTASRQDVERIMPLISEGVKRVMKDHNR